MAFVIDSDFIAKQFGAEILYPSVLVKTFLSVFLGDQFMTNLINWLLSQNTIFNQSGTWTHHLPENRLNFVFTSSLNFSDGLFSVFICRKESRILLIESIWRDLPIIRMSTSILHKSVPHWLRCHLIPETFPVENGTKHFIHVFHYLLNLSRQN